VQNEDLRALPQRRVLGLQDGEVLVGTFILQKDGSVLFVFDTKFTGILTPPQKLKLAVAFTDFLFAGLVS